MERRAKFFISFHFIHSYICILACDKLKRVRLAGIELVSAKSKIYLKALNKKKKIYFESGQMESRLLAKYRSLNFFI